MRQPMRTMSFNSTASTMPMDQDDDSGRASSNHSDITGATKQDLASLHSEFQGALSATAVAMAQAVEILLQNDRAEFTHIEAKCNAIQEECKQAEQLQWQSLQAD